MFKSLVVTGCVLLTLNGGAKPLYVSEPPTYPGPESWTFKQDLAEPIAVQPVAKGEPWVKNRISRCFFGPIKRPPLYHDELMDDVDYYPDAYLDRLSKEGVNGLWLTIEWRDLATTSFLPPSPDAPRRLKKLRATVDKCLKYGIKTWIFCIEPKGCAKNDPLYLAHPEMFNPNALYGMHVLCPSQATTRQYIRESVKDIFVKVPRLGGIMMISHGERPTTCLSAVDTVTGKRLKPCAQCDHLEPWQIYNLFAESIVAGIRDAGSKAEFISWFYQPAVRSERAPWVAECARHVPDGVIFAYNFESGAVKEQLGRVRHGGDYWLSYAGPAVGFEKVASATKAAKRSLGAKIQVCNSHECATVPYVPVPGLLYRKYKAMKAMGVTTVLQCWYFGNYPGLMNRAAGMLSYSDFTESEDEFLLQLAKPEWGDDAPEMARIWKRFSDAYENYPLSNCMQYYGPFHAGIAWPLFAGVCLEPLARTWKPHDLPSGDFIGECLENHTLAEALELAQRMAQGTRTIDTSGKDELDVLTKRYANNRERLRDLGVMKALQILFESASDVFAFYNNRAKAIYKSRQLGDYAGALDLVKQMLKTVEREQQLTEMMLPLAKADSRLGFHSEAEAHLFHPAKLEWRLGELVSTKQSLNEIAVKLSKGEPYPESAFEQQVARCMSNGDWMVMPGKRAFKVRYEPTGDFTIELQLADVNDAVCVLTCDAAGITRPKNVFVNGKGEAHTEMYNNVLSPQHQIIAATKLTNGMIRVTLSAAGWENNSMLRPAYLQVRQGGFWSSPKQVLWPQAVPLTNPELRLNLGHIEGQAFGRIVQRERRGNSNISLISGLKAKFNHPCDYKESADERDPYQLTDGIHCPQIKGKRFWSHREAVGGRVQSEPLTIDFDLGAVKSMRGFSASTAGSAASVGLPRLIAVFTSEDGKSWRFAGDLWAKHAALHGHPDQENYTVMTARSEQMPARGRYVKFVIQGDRSWWFFDELEVLPGDEAIGAEGPITANPIAAAKGLHYNSRLMLDARKLGCLEKFSQAIFNAQYDGEVTNRHNLLPFRGLGEKIAAVNSIALRKAGINDVCLWNVKDRWANMDMYQIPTTEELAVKPLKIVMAEGETRSTAINIANPLDSAVECEARVEGLPVVNCHEVLVYDMPGPIAVAGALKRGEGNSIRLRLPAGISRQLWISFVKPTSGNFSGKLEISVMGKCLEVPIILQVKSLPKRDAKMPIVCGWDYLDGEFDSRFGYNHRKAKAIAGFRRELTDLHCDTTAATPATAPTIKKDGSLDFTRWDRWIARMPKMRYYVIFMGLGWMSDKDIHPFRGMHPSQPDFEQKAGAYISAWSQHVAQNTPDAKVMLLPFDEPREVGVGAKIVPWLKLIHRYAPNFEIQETALFDKPELEDAEFFTNIDVVKPNILIMSRSPKSINHFLLERQRGRRVWLGQTSGPAPTMDPIWYYRFTCWYAALFDAEGVSFWSFGDAGGIGDSFRTYDMTKIDYSPIAMLPDGAMCTKQSEALREGVEDYRLLMLLKAKDVQLFEQMVREPFKIRGYAIPPIATTRWNAKNDRNRCDDVRLRILQLLQP